MAGQHKETETAEHSRKKRKTKGGSLGRSQRQGGYGKTEGQLSNMSDSEVDAVISSPPYEEYRVEALKGGCLGNNMDPTQPKGTAYWKVGDYGHTEGQMGYTKGATFWDAARDILLQCFQILKPNGVAVFVVKDFVRKGQRVPFSDDWLRLCESCGFKLICRHKAMLVKTTERNSLFGMEEKRIEKKGFFRKLHEAKMPPGDPRRIDWEDILCFEKPNGT
jgi:hypothetical protein